MLKIIVSFIFLSVSPVLSFDVIPNLLLNNGHKMPIVGFGAMRIVEEAIRWAITDGYRHIDTSLNYNDSELLIANVLKDVFNKTQIKREDLFIVSKLEGKYHPRHRVPEGIKLSLSRLGLDYLDLYLVHHPDKDIPDNTTLEETWLGMIDVLKANLTKSIGVSNFNEEQLARVMTLGVKPVTNQVLCNPYRNSKKLLAYLTAHNITLTAYSPLGGVHDPNLLKDPKLEIIGRRHNVSPAQVALNYQIQRGVIVIPKANTPKYIKENIDLFEFKLTEQDIKDIESLNKFDG